MNGSFLSFTSTSFIFVLSLREIIPIFFTSFSLHFGSPFSICFFSQHTTTCQTKHFLSFSYFFSPTVSEIFSIVISLIINLSSKNINYCFIIFCSSVCFNSSPPPSSNFFYLIFSSSASP